MGALGGDEVMRTRDLTKGTGVLIREALRDSSPPSCEDSVRGRSSTTQKKAFIRTWASLRGLVLLSKGPPENSLPFPPFEDTMRRWQSATRKRILSRAWPCWHPSSDVPLSSAVRNKPVVYKPPGLWWFVIAALTKPLLYPRATSGRTLHTAGA